MPATQCTAKSKQSGERCKRRPVRGMAVCKMHGGNTPKGISSPHFKHGHHSKHIPLKRLQDIYESIKEGIDLYSSDDDLLLLNARILQLLESGESNCLWKNIKMTWKRFKAAARVNDKGVLNDVFQELDKLIEAGSRESAQWEEIYQVMRQLDRTRERAVKMQIETHLLIRADVAIAMFAPLIRILEERVKDPDIFRALLEEWDRITTAAGCRDNNH